jgi:hypothetical protein
MDVEFIGSQSYGKPVGFFDININKYIMYTPEFSVENSAGQGGYYQGFIPGTTGYPGYDSLDDLTKNWGDPTEGLFALALSDVTTGAYSVPNKVIQSLSESERSFKLLASNPKMFGLNKHKFIGMIGDKKAAKLLKRK